jgi:hypothetical protein
MSQRHPQHTSEMNFFRKAQTFYDSTLDSCGDIKQSLSHLKKKLDQSGAKVPADKWARLDSALRSGEIVRGKRSTPGDWAEAEIRRLKAQS